MCDVSDIVGPDYFVLFFKFHVCSDIGIIVDI
jgi:hypothetical protein